MVGKWSVGQALAGVMRAFGGGSGGGVLQLHRCGLRGGADWTICAGTCTLLLNKSLNAARSAT